MSVGWFPLPPPQVPGPGPGPAPEAGGRQLGLSRRSREPAGAASRRPPGQSLGEVGLRCKWPGQAARGEGQGHCASPVPARPLCVRVPGGVLDRSARRRGKAARGHPHPTHRLSYHQPAAGVQGGLNAPWPHQLGFHHPPPGPRWRRGEAQRPGPRPGSGRGPGPTRARPEETWNVGPRKALRGLILRSGAKSTTFRHNLISFSINTKCKPCPSVSMWPVAISASLSVGSRAGGMCGRVFLNTELQSIRPRGGPRRGGRRLGSLAHLSLL